MIEFRNVSKQYSTDTYALHDVSFTVAKGELVFLAGPSGAGKSTLLKMIAAIERPSAGQVLINGTDISRIRPAAIPSLRRNLGLIFQQQRLLTDRSILANVMLPLLVAGAAHKEAETRARAALEKVGLADRADAQPLALSGGEQQRVSIARAIVNRPQLILADEPTANLDTHTANQVIDLLRQLGHEHGTTVLVATHDDRMSARCDRSLTLTDGVLR